MLNTITMKVVGVSFEGRQTPISELTINNALYLKPEPDNRYDSNAIQVFDENDNRLGYIPKQFAKLLKNKITDRHKVSEFKRYGGGNRKNYGIEIKFNY